MLERILSMDIELSVPPIIEDIPPSIIFPSPLPINEELLLTALLVPPPIKPRSEEIKFSIPPTIEDEFPSITLPSPPPIKLFKLSALIVF